MDNGAIVLVEPMPRSERFPCNSGLHRVTSQKPNRLTAIVTCSSTRRARPGWTANWRLESQACFLKASTYRDATQVELTVGPDQLPLAMDALATILRRPEITQERIDTEVKIMREELALRDDASRLSSAAWLAAYGETGIDPVGSFDSTYRASPEKLADVFAKQFAADGLVLVIAGPVDLDGATNMGRVLLTSRVKSSAKATHPTREARPGGQAVADGGGEARAAPVRGFNSPQTAAALAAALAVASEFQTAFVTYTPTVQNGLVLVGRTDASSGVAQHIDTIKEPTSLYNVGRQLAREWVKRQLRTPSGVGYLRGMLLSQGAATGPKCCLSKLTLLPPSNSPPE